MVKETYTHTRMYTHTHTHTHTHLLLCILLSCGAGHVDAFVLFNLFNPCSLSFWLIWVVHGESDVHDYPLFLERTSTVRTPKSTLCLTAMLLPGVIDQASFGLTIKHTSWLDTSETGLGGTFSSLLPFVLPLCLRLLQCTVKLCS